MKFKKSPAFKYLNFGISFGLTLAITLYLLYLGGQWLDAKLGTSPLFMTLGILLAVATVFKRLLIEVKELEADTTPRDRDIETGDDKGET